MAEEAQSDPASPAHPTPSCVTSSLAADPPTGATLASQLFLGYDKQGSLSLPLSFSGHSGPALTPQACSSFRCYSNTPSVGQFTQTRAHCIVHGANPFSFTGFCFVLFIFFSKARLVVSASQTSHEMQPLGVSGPSLLAYHYLFNHSQACFPGCTHLALLLAPWTVAGKGTAPVLGR